MGDRTITTAKRRSESNEWLVDELKLRLLFVVLNIL